MPLTMFVLYLTTFFILVSSALTTRPTDYTEKPRYHHITSLTSSPSPPHTPFLTCLRLPEPLTKYPTTGFSLPLPLPLSTQAHNMTFVVLPSHTSEGWHNPPVPMFFVLLRGEATVYTYDPHNKDGDDETEQISADPAPPDGCAQQSIIGRSNLRHQKVSISVGSPNQILLALDLKGRGHWTDYPSGEETWALQIPLAEGWEDVIRGWDVIGEGACG